MTRSQPGSSKRSQILSPGDRLGPYQIVGLLGSGGMGEVYRAYDSRLTRDVALKVLRRELDAEHVARFSREARAAGTLNHPNIVAVFDVGTEAGVPYVVTELLEGETLRARMDHGPLPYRKAIEYGIQIAQALDAAHAKGIWHRDVKPANAFITHDGRVKLLDFGIAKLGERATSEAEASAETATATTGERVVRGTAGYMAPEQVLGEPVDHRADIFALGAVLYEMFAGARPFERASTVETMTAVLQDDPPDPLVGNPRLPAAAAAVVRRCLEKSKEERFQSARDLAFALQQLREGEATGAVRARRGRQPLRRWLLPAILAAAVLAEGVALALFLSRPARAPAFEQLSFRRGRIGGARFVSRGEAVVYSEARDRNELDVWRIDLADSPASPSRRLEYPSGTEVLAARTGALALSLRRHFVLGERFVGTLAVAPLGGGAPREVSENIEDADWDPAGTHLAMVESSGDVGGNSRIVYPPGTTLYETSGSIRFLRFSRDGQRIAFVEDPAAGGVAGRVAVVDLKGTVTPLTDEWSSARGLAWSADGDEIWFTAGAQRSNRALRAVNLERKQRVVLEVPGSLTLWDIAPDGRVLLTRDEERRAVVGVPPGESAERDLSWFDNSGLADLSEDGRWLLFRDAFGLYIRGTDGSPPIHLGVKEAFGDDLSHDGRLILATQGRQLVVIPRGAGEPRRLPTHGIVSYRGARWFPDGRRVLFNGQEARPAGPGGEPGSSDLRAYIQDLEGSPPRPLTPEGTWGVSISPDGLWVAAMGTSQSISLWPVAGGAPRQVAGTEPTDRPAAWSEDGRSLWILRRGEIPAQVYQLDIATGRRRPWKTLVPPDAAGVYSIIEFRITPRGDSYFYSFTRLLSQLYLVRGLR